MSILFLTILIVLSISSLVCTNQAYALCEDWWFYIFFINLIAYDAKIIGLIINIIFYGFFFGLPVYGFIKYRGEKEVSLHVLLLILTILHGVLFAVLYEGLSIGFSI